MVNRLIQATMQRAELVGMCPQSKWACNDLLNRINGVDDIKNGNLSWITSELDSTAEPALAPHQFRSGERLKDFGHIVARTLCAIGDLSGGLRTPRVLNEPDNDSQGVFGRARNQLHPHKLDIDIQFSKPTLSNL